MIKIIGYIKLRTTSLENWLGQVKTINNGSINTIINYSKTNSLAVVKFDVDYSTDLQHITNIMPAFFLAEISEVTNNSLPRTAQLTQKTNQFNATTKRYLESDILNLMEQKNWFLYTFQVTDRFGDNGIVGVILSNRVQDKLIIDTFLLSCRVIGRKIETSMLAFLFDLGKSRTCPTEATTL